MAAHLVILGAREAIRWVVTEGRMAFTTDRASTAARSISIGDSILLYATRGAYHNPAKDRGRVFGCGIVESSVDQLPEPVELIGRQFTHGFDLSVTALASPRSGVELAPLVPRLTSLPNTKGWPMLLRRPFLSLNPEDARMLRKLVQAQAVSLSEAIPSYAALLPVRRA